MRTPRRLVVVYNESCALCRRWRHWLEWQPTYLPLDYLGQISALLLSASKCSDAGCNHRAPAL